MHRCVPTLLLRLALGLAAAGAAAAVAAAGTPDHAGAGAREVPYEAAITGVVEPALRDLLERTSKLLALEGSPPASLAGLRRRVEDDVELLETALRSEGFYASEIGYRIDETAAPVEVTVDVATGPVYLLADYAIDYVPEPPVAKALPSGPDAVALRLGAPARAQAIVAAQRKLLRRLSEAGHPLARVVDRKVVVDHARRAASVELRVDPGPEARFGVTAVAGLEEVELDYVRRLVPWGREELYDQRKVDALRAALMDTNLFSSVKAEPGAAVAADGRLPVTVRVEERKHRSIGAGASFSSSEGFGAEVFWEHRNLFGRQEQLRLSLTVAEIIQGLSARFRKPHFGRLDQTLLLDTALTMEDTDAFRARSASQFIGLERRITDHLTVSGGPSFEYAVLDDKRTEETFALFGLPLAGRWDDTDDPLDPARGGRLRLGLTPFVGSIEETVTFLVSELSASAYQSLAADDRVVLAERLRLGSIAGETTETIPANKRFFAGGGGSIRGFEFQTVGPLDVQNDPLGGRSVIEAGAELRLRVTDSLGLVPFVEGGNVYDSTLPDFSEAPLWAAGLGVRYFTAVGPVRLDVAFPLNPRDVDDTFEFYISLGQAF